MSIMRKLFQTIENLNCCYTSDGIKIPRKNRADSGPNARMKMPEQTYAVLTSRQENGKEVKKVYGPK